MNETSKYQLGSEKLIHLTTILLIIIINYKYIYSIKLNPSSKFTIIRKIKYEKEKIPTSQKSQTRSFSPSE